MQHSELRICRYLELLAPANSARAGRGARTIMYYYCAHDVSHVTCVQNTWQYYDSNEAGVHSVFFK